MTNRIREFRRARGFSLQQLAEASGTSKSQIDKLERGDRRLTVDWMVRLAKPLGCDPRALMLQPGMPESLGETPVSALIPVRGPVAAPPRKAGMQGQMIFAATPVDQVPRPFYLAHARDAYALTMTDDSMSPMFRPRQMLFVNPYKPPAPGGGVVVVTTQGGVGVREYIGPKTGTKPGVILRQHYPKRRDSVLALSDIASLHAVVGTMEPQ